MAAIFLPFLLPNKRSIYSNSDLIDLGRDLAMNILKTYLIISNVQLGLLESFTKSNSFCILSLETHTSKYHKLRHVEISVLHPTV